MTAEFEDIKKVLSKRFCFMEWQRKDAEAEGEESMTAEDLRKIRKFNYHLPLFYVSNLLEIIPTKEKLSITELEVGLKKAREGEMIGILIKNNFLYIEHRDILKEKKLYLAEENLLDSTLFFFKEEHQLVHKVNRIKNLIGDLSSFVSSNII